MIILQTAGSGDARGLPVGAHLLGDLSAQATTFQDNDYIHRLNRALQAEMRAVAAYRSVGRRQRDVSPADLDAILADHQRAGCALQRLIIGCRGIPEDRPALSFGLTATVMTIVARVPSRLAERVTLGTLQRLEAHLAETYAKLLTMAPSKDRPTLNELLADTERHLRRTVS